VVWGCVLALSLSSLASGTAAAQVFSEELRVKGFWPDLALELGAGFGLGQRLATPVLGRVRLGALYAYEPLILNLGISGELGALARRGLGVELEINHFGGVWLQGGFERVRGDDWMTHATLGFSVVGVEWQHRFNDRPDNALLFVVRAPLGIISFLLHDDARRTREQRERQKGAPPPQLPPPVVPPPQAAPPAPAAPPPTTQAVPVPAAAPAAAATHPSAETPDSTSGVAPAATSEAHHE
jgi:hypothetical protein